MPDPKSTRAEQEAVMDTHAGIPWAVINHQEYNSIKMAMKEKTAETVPQILFYC